MTEKKDLLVRNLLRVGYVCLGRATFDLQMAQMIAQRSAEALQQQNVSMYVIPDLITSVDAAMDVAQKFAGNIDVLLTQFTTFVDGRFLDVMAKRLDVPIILWSIREPNQRPGERLSLNSLTGANMAGQRLYRIGVPFQFVLGNPDESQLVMDLKNSFRFWAAWKRLHQFKIITLGNAPDGFHFSMPGASAQSQLGIALEHLDLTHTFERAMQLDPQEVKSEIIRLQDKVKGLSQLPTDSVEKFARMMTVLRHDLKHREADAVAVRCWPEFFTEFGAAACSTLSALIEDGIMGACEADILGALSMDILKLLTDSPAYLGDLVEIDEVRQTVVFWHCGAGAFSLARQDTGAVAGKHPNRNIGFTLEFGLKSGKITILRIGEAADGSVRVLIGEGEVLDEPQRFLGTSAKVRLAGDKGVVERVTNVIEQGFEPHYALSYGCVAIDLERLFRLLNIPVTRF